MAAPRDRRPRSAPRTPKPTRPVRAAVGIARAPEATKAAPKASAPHAAPRALRVESIAAGGAGLARDEGRAIFVPRTAPGDLVEAAIEPRGGALSARVLRLIEPGPGRVEAPCRFFDACGGCDLMHLSIDAQRAAHEAIVIDALRRTGGFEALPSIASHAVPAEATEAAEAPALAYRTRARFFAKTSRAGVWIGFRAPGTHDLTAITTCLVLVPALDRLLGELPKVLDRARGEGEISVALGEADRPVVDVAWRGELPPEVWARIDARVKEGAWAGARVWLDGATTPATFGDPRPLLRGADGAPLVVAAGGFAQPSGAAAAVIARRAAALAQRSGDKLGSIVELFAGSGALSILLAPIAAKFVAVESQDEAVQCARRNLAARGLEGKITCADAGAFDPGRADVVVLDPPRTGARAAIEKIAASATRSVVYVACDPTTMARDLAVLRRSGFTLTDLELVESFPQTSHVETLARLTRGKR